jgi:hypothetical protein
MFKIVDVYIDALMMMMTMTMTMMMMMIVKMMMVMVMVMMTMTMTTMMTIILIEPVCFPALVTAFQPPEGLGLPLQGGVEGRGRNAPRRE